MTDILLNKTLDVLGTNKGYHELDRQTPMTKQETLPKGLEVAIFYVTKTFRNQLFSSLILFDHKFLITKHSESNLKSKIVSILMIIIVVVFFCLIFNKTF